MSRRRKSSLTFLGVGAIALTGFLLNARVRHAGGSTRPSHPALGRVEALTDKNAADITRSLSADGLNSPSGLAALQRWLDVDRRAAAVWMSQRTAGTTDAQARAVVRALLKDPEFFRQYCEQLPPGEWAQKFWRGAIYELSAKNPTAAIGLVSRVDSNEERTELFRSIAAEWLKRDPEPAFRWLLGVKNDFVSDEQLCVGVKAYAATDPIRAMEWLVALVRSDEAINDTLLAVYGGWVEKKPAEAARVVALLADDETRKGAVAVVAHAWMRSDPMTAYIWLKGLPEFDGLVAGLPAD